MNINIRSLVSAIILSAFAMSFSSCVKEEVNPNLRRDTDAVNIAYNEGATATVTVRYNGQWHAVSESDWLSVSPDSSEPVIGNGTDFQKVTITAKRNSGESREGSIRIVSENGTYSASVKVTQADGQFTIEKPVLTGTLTKGESAAAAILVKYSKAAGGEKIVIEANISGDAALSIAQSTEFIDSSE